MEDLKIKDLHPTQLTIGFKEVDYKVHEIDKLLSDPKQYRQYVEAKKGLVVIGPDQINYLVDGHHVVAALNRLGITEMPCKIEHDWSDETTEDFWKKMDEHSYYYPVNAQGQRLSFKDLPETLDGLKDDSFRSLAWLVRKGGGYDELDIPFQEFYWAEFFRDEGVAISGKSAQDYLNAAMEALVLAKSQKAKRLKDYGYNPAPVDPEEYRAEVWKKLNP